jgi:predicted nuclease with TOPRIM domain
MNWQEIAGGVVNALRNAGVKKDVIDLQEKQIGLLTKEIETLTRNLNVSETETANLKQKLKNLELQFDRLRPTSDLDDEAVGFLKLLAQYGRLSLQEIMGLLKISQIKAEYHRDVLHRKEMIVAGQRVMAADVIETYKLLPKGRDYLIKHGHVT